VLSAGDTSIIVTNSNHGGLQATFNATLTDIISWFQANFLSLNFNKMYYLEFRTINCTDITLDVIHFNKFTANVTHTQFLGLVIDYTLTWNNHIDQFISRLNCACYTIKAAKAMLSRLYFSYIHSIVPYGIIFWGNSITYGIIFWGNTPNSIKIFRLKKIKNYNLKKMDSCTELFKTKEILPFYSQCIFSLFLYVVYNKHLFNKN
jgi:hypothetical protein